VYSYSSSSLSLLYKLGDPWIGSHGSLLYITALIALLYGIYILKGSKEEPLYSVTRRILDGFIVFFILLTLLQSPFEVLSATPPEGLGLNPLLQSPWVLIHPPIIFLGYAAVFFAFALQWAGILTRRSEGAGMRRSLTLPLYAAWLLLTVGIALGGVWSYRVLGWGGYWAWDPVETASLLPWLALTAYLHLAPAGRESTREIMLLITFLMVIFATALTRGGFSESVHAFGESPAGYMLLAFGGIVLLLFLAAMHREGRPLLVSSPDASTLYTLSRSVASISLIALLAVCFTGAAAPAAGSIMLRTPLNISPEFFTLACYPFTLAFVAALIGCNSPLRPRSYAFLLAALAGIGALLVVIRYPTPYALANFGLPFLVAAGGFIAYEMLGELISRRRSLRLLGRRCIHLALVIILLGVFISSAGQVETRPLLATPGSHLTVWEYQILCGNFTVSPGVGRVYFPSHSLVAPEYSSLSLDVTVLEESVHGTGTLTMSQYLNHGVVSEPLIFSTPSRDLYLSMHQTNSSYTSLLHALIGDSIPPNDATLVVKEVPFIGLVWVGILLMGSGMGILFLDEVFRRIREAS
jgi:Cytochrome c biogenesis factor